MRKKKLVFFPKFIRVFSSRSTFGGLIIPSFVSYHVRVYLFFRQTVSAKSYQKIICFPFCTSCPVFNRRKKENMKENTNDNTDDGKRKNEEDNEKNK